MEMNQTSFQVNGFTDTKEYRKGYKAENVIAELLRIDGCYVVVTADIQMRNGNGAPGAIGENQRFITLPDLDVAKKGYRAFVEVKHKGGATFTTITGRDEHGIGLRSFMMYQKAAKEFGSNVLLFIYEANSGAVLYNSVDILLPDRDDYHIETRGSIDLVYQQEGEISPVARVYKGNAMDTGGMIFFARSSFDIWGKVALVGDDIYTQMGLFDTVEGRGDKMYSILRHKAPIYNSILKEPHPNL